MNLFAKTCFGALLLSGLGACATPAITSQAETGDRYALSELNVYAPRVDAVEERVEIATSEDPAGILAGRARAERFGSLFLKLGDGPIIMNVPAGSTDERVVRRQSEEIRSILYAQGVSLSAIATRPYAANGTTNAPITLSFRRYTAIPYPCAPLNEIDLSDAFHNQSNPAHGCTVNWNIAAMVANPRDLVLARELGPSDADRRQIVIEKYESGTPTQTERGAGENGTVSTAVN